MSNAWAPDDTNGMNDARIDTAKNAMTIFRCPGQMKRNTRTTADAVPAMDDSNSFNFFTCATPFQDDDDLV